MTRDEAIKGAKACFRLNVPSQEWLFTPTRLVAALENLGLLKFDEPKSARDRAEEAVRAKYIEKVASDLFDIIDAVGCKIVEK